MGTGASKTDTQGGAATQGAVNDTGRGGGFGQTAGGGPAGGGIGRFIGGGGGGTTGAGSNRVGEPDRRDSFLNSGNVGPTWNNNDTKPNVRFQDKSSNAPRQTTNNTYPSDEIGTTTVRRKWGAFDTTERPLWESDNQTPARQVPNGQKTAPPPPPPTTKNPNTNNPNNRRGFFDWFKSRKAKPDEKQKGDAKSKTENANDYASIFPNTPHNPDKSPGKRQSNTPYHGRETTYPDDNRTNAGRHDSSFGQSGEETPYYADRRIQPNGGSSGQGNLVYPLGEDPYGPTNSDTMNGNPRGTYARYSDVQDFQGNTVVYRNVEQLEVSSLGSRYHAERREQRLVNNGPMDDPWAPVGGERSLQPNRRHTTNLAIMDTAQRPPTNQTHAPVRNNPRLPSYEDSQRPEPDLHDGKDDLNLRFYRNEIKFKPEGTNIVDVHDNWFANYPLLEDNQDFMAWLFPLPEGDTMNPMAQPLQDHEARAIWGDKTIRNRVKMSYNLMLNVFGMILKDHKTGDIGRTKDWRTLYGRFTRSDQSKHRVTRILRSLGALGFGSYQTPFVLFLLHEVLVTKQIAMTTEDDTECVEDWIDAISDLNERTTVGDFYNQYKYRGNTLVSGYGQTSGPKGSVPGSAPSYLANTETPSLLHHGYRVMSQ